MENGIIFFADGKEYTMPPLISGLLLRGHRVVLTAFSLKNALLAVNEGLLGEKGVNVAIVGDGFPDGSGEITFSGLVIVEAIRRREPSIKVITYNEFTVDETINGTAHVFKGYSNPAKLLAEAIASLVK
ncbi:MAG: hypothetical protein AAB837_02435 [Patescibacteria group bacterium]